MGLPRSSDNLRGYAMAALNDKVENLRHKQFFLVHGTLDDNVHYQQSMMLSKTLEHNDILFRQQVILTDSYKNSIWHLLGLGPRTTAFWREIFSNLPGLTQCPQIQKHLIFLDLLVVY